MTPPTRVDFSRLSWGTLRKYQYYFNVKEQSKSISARDSQAVIEAVKSHFEEMRVDPTKLVAKFLRVKKDEKNDLNYNLRKANNRRPGASMLNFTPENGLMN